MRSTNSINKSFNLFDICNYFILSAVILLMGVPFYYLAVNSLTPESVILKQGYTFFPTSISLHAYYIIFNISDQILRSIGITIFITVVGTLMNLIITFFFAYTLSRKEVPGRSWMMVYLVISMIFSAGLIPWAIVVKNCGLINSIWVYIIPSLLNPWYTILIRNFFMEIPSSLREAAIIDGCSEFLVLVKIVLPVSKPIIATLTLFYAIDNWNRWFECLIFITDNRLFSLQYLIYQLLTRISSLQTASSGQAQQSSLILSSETVKLATIMVSTIPIMLVYPFVQKYFLKGIMVGSVKE